MRTRKQPLRWRWRSDSGSASGSCRCQNTTLPVERGDFDKARLLFCAVLPCAVDLAARQVGSEPTTSRNFWRLPTGALHHVETTRMAHPFPFQKRLNKEQEGGTLCGNPIKNGAGDAIRTKNQPMGVWGLASSVVSPCPHHHHHHHHRRLSPDKKQPQKPPCLTARERPWLVMTSPRPTRRPRPPLGLPQKTCHTCVRSGHHPQSSRSSRWRMFLTSTGPKKPTSIARKLSS